MFESDVLAFIDRMAAEQQRNRSFIINQVIRHFARTMAEKQGVVVEAPKPLPAIQV